MNIIITESQSNNLKDMVLPTLKSKGFLFAVKVVNGFDNLIKILDISKEDIFSYLNLFDDMDVVQSQENDGLTLFRYKEEKNLMVYDKVSGVLHVSMEHFYIPLVKKDFYGVKTSSGVEQYLISWVTETFDVDIITDILIYDYNEEPIYKWVM